MATNVERLTQYKNKMILFPVRADKPKKGEINDSTADKLATASQNTTDGVFALPRLTRKGGCQKLTSELKSFNAYKTLRQARITKRMAGKKEKEAREAAAGTKKK